VTPPRPSAQLRLRGGDLGAQLIWPAGPPTGTLVLLVGADEAAHGESICRALSDALGVVALSVPCRGADDGATAVEWAADHAAQIGADGARLILGGLHAGADAAAALAVRARDEGWPDIACLVLIHAHGRVPPGLSAITVDEHPAEPLMRELARRIIRATSSRA